MNLTVSVITAVYNSANTVADALASVRGQSWRAMEHIVIDGASTDGSLPILHAHAAQLAVLVSEPDKGIYDALNKGIARATGDVLGFLHADDVFAGPDVLAHVAAAFADPAVDAVYGDLDYVRQSDVTRRVRRWRSGPFRPGSLAWGWMPPHPALYVRRGWYERIGGFDTRYRISADYDSILRLFSRPDFNAVYLPEVLVKMRLGGASNGSVKAVLRKSREDYDALRRNQMGGLGALACKNISKLGQFF